MAWRRRAGPRRSGRESRSRSSPRRAAGTSTESRTSRARGRRWRSAYARRGAAGAPRRWRCRGGSSTPRGGRSLAHLLLQRLEVFGGELAGVDEVREERLRAADEVDELVDEPPVDGEIGRASCRERV